MPIRRNIYLTQAALLGVKSRHLMDRINAEAFGLGYSLLANEFIWSQALEHLEYSTEIVGIDEVRQMLS